MKIYYFSPFYLNYESMPLFSIVVDTSESSSFNAFQISKTCEIIQTKIQRERVYKMIEDEVILEDIPDVYKTVNVHKLLAKKMLYNHRTNT